MTDADLRVWAEAHPDMPQATAVLALLDDRNHLRSVVAAQGEELDRLKGKLGWAEGQIVALRQSLAEHGSAGVSYQREPPPFDGTYRVPEERTAGKPHPDVPNSGEQG
jgi:hypothetical protein